VWETLLNDRHVQLGGRGGIPCFRFRPELNPKREVSLKDSSQPCAGIHRFWLESLVSVDFKKLGC
jgi:hypothetical protein